MICFFKFFLYKTIMAKQNRTRRDILEHLKTAGPQEASALGDALALTAMAVRQHLYDLQAEGMVEAQPAPRPVGRPAKIWHLTDAAGKHFPDAHQDLAVDLIEAVRNSLGEAALDTLIAERSDRQAAAYSARLSTKPDLGTRLEELATIRTEEGYMASVEATEDGFLFVENHCPICSAAASCTGICAMELQVFARSLGPGAEIERTDHILAGARRCAYRVTPASAD